ncbi:MAG: hypothetical protein LBD67_01810 [Candidatus Accumulibacter sp.]|nr:hypothetical protein [Accumulibacter sp.]
MAKGRLRFGRLARPFMLRQAQHERREALLMRFDRLPSSGSGQAGRTDWEDIWREMRY